MPEMSIYVHRRGDPPICDTPLPGLIHVTEALWDVVLIEGGLQSGKTSVLVAIPLPGGRNLVAETTLALWSSVTIMARGAFPGEFAGGPLAIPESGPGGLSERGDFEFTRDADGNLDLRAAVRQAIAATAVYAAMQASVAPGEIAFDTDPIEVVASALIRFLES